MSTETQSKSLGDHAHMLAGLLMPLVLVYLGHVYKETEAKDGLQEKYVEMAIDILKAEPTDATLEIRKWAMEVLHVYSDAPIHAAAREHILRVGIQVPE